MVSLPSNACPTASIISPYQSRFGIVDKMIRPTAYVRTATESTKSVRVLLDFEDDLDNLGSTTLSRNPSPS